MKRLNFCHRRSSIGIIIKFGIITSLISFSLGLLFTAKASQIPNKIDTVKISQIFVETDTAHGLVFDTTNLGYDKKDIEVNKTLSSGIPFGEGNVPSFWTSYIFDPMRCSLKYELAYKIKKPIEVKNDRFSFRAEYSRSLFRNFSLQLDTKILTFLKDDHRTRSSTFWINDYPYKAETAFEGRTREAYLQTSFHKTSIKVGLQVLAWGESDFAPVTDEISPMDYREPLILNIDELKIGQLLLSVDQYSQFGNWSGFFIPYPQFNKHPRTGDGYYYDSFNGSVEFQKEKQSGNFFEYGIRWKKTFGKNDVSIMAANLIDNEYASQMVSPSLITQSKWRYSMAGMTFNHAVNNFLFKGEVAIKSSKAYNNTSFQIVKKNNLDASFGFDYSVNSTFTLSMEGVNYHIMGWNDKVSVTEDNYMMVLILSKLFMNNDLSVDWITMYNGPYNNFFNMLTTSFKWNDHIVLSFDALIPISNNISSDLYIYRDQKQVAFKIQYQF